MADPTLRAHTVLGCVQMERIKQDVKWGEQNHADLAWLAILGEEFGEASQCVTKSSVGPTEPTEAKEYYELLEYELVQVAAVCVAWLECIRRREATDTGGE